ncbi:MAG: alpha/beta hydrolase-fold protein [Chloroflexota bacterium]|nr:alpha/beta hydrolase-fold protein [Chloroflexota bacterium]
MRPIIYTLTTLLLALLAAGCETLAPIPTPTRVVIVVTAEPTLTPLPTATPTATRLPTLTPTPLATPTATIIPCVAEGGQLLEFDDFRSESTGERLTYSVYAPPCYIETQKRYPVVLLMPGLAGEGDWIDLGIVELLNDGIRRGELPPMLVVMPPLGSIGTDNTFPPADSYETVIMDELLPAIQRDFCTIDDRQQRAIGGISRGGFWAYSIAMRHPDVFGIVGGHSAFFDPDNAPEENNPLDLALDTSLLTDADLRMYIDNAAIDFVGSNLELFSSRLSARGIPHTYIINPVGDHNDEYWGSHLNEYLAFYGRDWARDAADLPGCA